MAKPIPNSLITLILKYQEKDGSDGQQTVRDIVTDIRHYCDEQGYDFQEVIKGSKEVYDQEKEEA